MVIKGIIEMSRPTYLSIDSAALLSNVLHVKRLSNNKKIIAMVKANAYGCGLSLVAPILEPLVDAFGVACLEEALAVRKLNIVCDCILFQGIFSPEELSVVVDLNLQLVIHQPIQLKWLLSKHLPTKIKVWVKVDTGMHRLGFAIDEVIDVISALKSCSWVDDCIGLITHLASSDELNNPSNKLQLDRFNALYIPYDNITRSIANSAAIISIPEARADAVRPGIMLYGVSPFANKTGQELGLIPVSRFMSSITTIHHYKAHESIGYGGTWQSDRPSKIGVVPVGYGDGYPRHIKNGTPTWVKDKIAPIVGRVSMDMLTIDLTHHPDVKIGDSVELWGQNIPVEVVAKSAGTIAYELLCQVSGRVIREVDK